MRMPLAKNPLIHDSGSHRFRNGNGGFTGAGNTLSHNHRQRQLYWQKNRWVNGDLENQHRKAVSKGYYVSVSPIDPAARTRRSDDL